METHGKGWFMLIPCIATRPERKLARRGLIARENSPLTLQRSLALTFPFPLCLSRYYRPFSAFGRAFESLGEGTVLARVGIQLSMNLLRVVLLEVDISRYGQT